MVTLGHAGHAAQAFFLAQFGTLDPVELLTRRRFEGLLCSQAIEHIGFCAGGAGENQVETTYCRETRCRARVRQSRKNDVQTIS